MTIDKNQKGSYAKVNGLDLYYEIYGSGQPLVLLPEIGRASCRERV